MAQPARRCREVPASAAAVERALHLNAIAFTDSALERWRRSRPWNAASCDEPRCGSVDLSAAQIAEQRRKGFWAEQDTELQAAWTLVLQAGQLLESAREIEKALGARAYSAAELIELYTGAANWAELDTLHDAWKGARPAWNLRSQISPKRLNSLCTRRGDGIRRFPALWRSGLCGRGKRRDSGYRI